jgi:phage protein D
VAASLDRPILYVTASPEGGATTPIDFTERIQSFEFTDELKKAEKLCLRVDNRDLSFWDDPTWRKGTIISATWGYPGHTTTRFLVVQSLKGGDTLTVEADGLSMLMHKNKKVRTFENMTLSQIATRIAADYGTVFGVPGGTIAGNIKVDGDVPMTRHQAAETTFLTRHARRRGLEFYVDSQGLHFKPLNVSQAPVKELVWYSGDGELLDYSVENDIRGRAGAVTKKGFDPLLKKMITNRSDNDSTRRDGLAPVIEIVDARTGNSTFQTRAAEEHVEHSPEGTAAGVKAHADGTFRQSQLHTLELSFKAVGDPDIVARRVLKFSGLGKRISGLYATTQVRHSIDNSGYVVSGIVKSNGTGGYGQRNAASKAAVNTKAPNNAPREVEVIDPRTGDPHIEYRKSDDEKQQ